MRPMSGEGAAGSGAGTPTGALVEQGDIMAAEAAVAALGDGDHNNAESGLSWKIKIFFCVFFLTCCRMGLYVNLRTVFLFNFFFIIPNKGDKP